MTELLFFLLFVCFIVLCLTLGWMAHELVNNAPVMQDDERTPALRKQNPETKENDNDTK